MFFTLISHGDLKLEEVIDLLLKQLEEVGERRVDLGGSGLVLLLDFVLHLLLGRLDLLLLLLIGAFGFH